jgi:hypothetical protein
VQSYEPDFSDYYLGNFYLETPEVNSGPITEAATEKPRFAPYRCRNSRVDGKPDAHKNSLLQVFKKPVFPD